MRRIIIVYNPRSSRFTDVKREVLLRANKLKGYMIGKYEVAPTNLDNNIQNLAKILKDNDLVISAGGDATGLIAANAILKSSKNATLAALPYGNFNDLSHTLGTMKFEDLRLDAMDERFEVVRDNGSELASEPRNDGRERSGPRIARPSVKKLYPLEIHVDGKFFRYATCYVTIGMTAEATQLYESPQIRSRLRSNSGRKIGSYFYLVKWYFKNRHSKQFIPEFKLNNIPQPHKTSDYIAVNGRFVARVMKGGEDYLNPTKFRHKTNRLTSFCRLFKFMACSILAHIPSSTTSGDALEFIQPTTITLQAEGESQIFKNIKKIEIKKGPKSLRVITH